MSIKSVRHLGNALARALALERGASVVGRRESRVLAASDGDVCRAHGQAGSGIVPYVGVTAEG